MTITLQLQLQLHKYIPSTTKQLHSRKDTWSLYKLQAVLTGKDPFKIGSGKPSSP